MHFLKDIGEHYCQAHLLSRFEMHPGTAMLDRMVADRLVDPSDELYQDCFNYKFVDSRIKEFYRDASEGFAFPEASLLENQILNNKYTLYKLKCYYDREVVNRNGQPAYLSKLAKEQRTFLNQVGEDNAVFFLGLVSWHETKKQFGKKPNQASFRDKLRQHKKTAEHIGRDMEKFLPEGIL